MAAKGLSYPVWTMVAMATSAMTIFINPRQGRPLKFLDAISSVGHPIPKRRHLS
jgi:hypothetical protein